LPKNGRQERTGALFVQSIIGVSQFTAAAAAATIDPAGGYIFTRYCSDCNTKSRDL